MLVSCSGMAREDCTKKVMFEPSPEEGRQGKRVCSELKWCVVDGRKPKWVGLSGILAMARFWTL